MCKDQSDDLVLIALGLAEELIERGRRIGGVHVLIVGGLEGIFLNDHLTIFLLLFALLYLRDTC